MKMDGENITTVVSDFDGTLLREGMNNPSEKFYHVLDEMLEKQIDFVAASGRQYPSLRRMLSHVADKIGFIAENGAFIVWKGQVVHKCAIPSSVAAELIEDMKQEPDTEILVSGTETAYVVPNNPEYTDALRKNHMEVTVLEDFSQVPEEMVKISIVYLKGMNSEAKNFFKEKYENDLLIVESGNGWLDFMPKESGKGPALEILAQKAGFSLDHTAAFGDQENDISMLQVAKVSYAMNTACDYVKAAAGNTCDVVEDVLSESFVV